ncbi:hypothetical protein B0T10DRAFT_552820 [Thelonectria olida]|uniref:RING-type domain-containing protein n=1 Tax=Thelonectria olida TaxID=1576542 RepID=A0A9P8VRU9_9HYPO|nr:hypothetical protein B0T10DRAFT_552820 [Thelonectria olida]
MKKFLQVLKKGKKPSVAPLENNTRQTTKTTPENPAQGVEPDPNAVATFSGFDSWLASFKPADSVASELPTEKEPVELPVKANEEARLKGLVHKNILVASECAVEQRPVELPVGANEEHPNGFADRYIHDQDDHETIMLVLNGVRKCGTTEKFNVTMKVPCCITFSRLSELLMAQGYQPPLSLRGRSGHTLDPDRRKGRLEIMVTSGPSRYDRQLGLLINQEVPLSSFTTELLRPRVACKDSRLTVNADQLTVAFHRTLRLPEDGTVYDLPANLGVLPLFNISAAAPKLLSSQNPSLVDMAKKGGIFFPLYQREAMYISFKSTRPFAIRVFTGGVNAVSGLPWTETTGSQDYLSVPPQKYLDGIALDRLTVRQFVAMPIGAGYSVEKQITGLEEVGGFQLLITPYGSPLSLSWTRLKQDYAEVPPVKSSRLETCHIKNTNRTPRDLGMEPGGLLRSDRSGSFPTIPDTADIFVKSLLDEDPWAPGKTVRVTPMYAFSVTILLRKSDGTKESIQVQWKPWDYLSSCLDAEVEGYKLANFMFRWKGELLYRGESTLESLGFADHETLDAAWMSPDERMNDLLARMTSKCDTLEQPLGWTMGIAGGSKLRQKILSDPHERYRWRHEHSALINVQILNSVIFESLTGMLPPPCPITAETYLQAGYPFFNFYGEGEAISQGWQNKTKSILSVGTMDAGKVDFGTTVAESRSVGCTICKTKLCDCILRPCNHSFCAACVERHMTEDKTITCAVCKQNAEGLVGFSAPMGLPGEDSMDMSSALLSVVQTNPAVAELEGVLEKNDELYKQMQRKVVQRGRLRRIR